MNIVHGALYLVVLLIVGSSGCCGGGSNDSPGTPSSPVTPTTPRQQVNVEAATFAKALGEDMTPRGATTEFHPHDKVNLSLAVEGRPRRGVVEAKFLYRDHQIAQAQTDFSAANSGVVFSIGGVTYVGFWLDHENPLYVSDAYKVVVTVDDVEIGSYPFKVIPPEGAIPSKVRSAVLAKSVTTEQEPVDPAKTFDAADLVHLVGRADLGTLSWLEVRWYANGEKVETATRSTTAKQNAEDTTFFFSARPEGGWPAGRHKAVLTLDEREVGTYEFDVVSQDAETGP